MSNDMSIASHSQQQSSSPVRVYLPPIRDANGSRQQQPMNVYSRDYGYRAPAGDIDLITNYQREFSRKTVTSPKQTARNNDRSREDLPKFEGETSYNHNFEWHGTSSSAAIDDDRRRHDKPAARQTLIIGSQNDRVVGPTRYTTDYVVPATGGLSPPMAPRRTTTGARNLEADGSPRKLATYSQQVTSTDHALNTANSDAGRQELEDYTAYRQAYGVRQTVPPAGSRRRPHEHRWAKDEARTPVISPRSLRDQLNDDKVPAEASNYQRDFTRKEIMTRASFKPRGETILTEPREHLFSSSTTHSMSFQRWKTDRLQHLNATPAAGERTDGSPGQGLSPGLSTSANVAKRNDRSFDSMLTSSRFDYSTRRTPNVDRLIAAAGLPTPGLDRTGQQTVNHRRVEVITGLHRAALSPSGPNDKKLNSSERGFNSDAATNDLFACDLQTIYRRFRQGYAQQDGISLERLQDQYPAGNLSSLDFKFDRSPKINKRPTERNIMIPDSLIAETNDDSTRGLPVVAGNALEGTPGDERNDLDPDANAISPREDDSSSPLFAPKFMGQYNYGFEYEKWANELEEQRQAGCDVPDGSSGGGGISGGGISSGSKANNVPLPAAAAI